MQVKQTCGKNRRFSKGGNSWLSQDVLRLLEKAFLSKRVAEGLSGNPSWTSPTEWEGLTSPYLFE